MCGVKTCIVLLIRYMYIIYFFNQWIFYIKYLKRCFSSKIYLDVEHLKPKLYKKVKIIQKVFKNVSKGMLKKAKKKIVLICKKMQTAIYI